MIHVGYQNYVNKNRIIAILRYKSTSSKALVKNAIEKGNVIDLSENKKRSLLILDNNLVIIVSSSVETLYNRNNRM